ncbi:MAG: protein kinase [Planctomycetaceae bacterium]
MTTCPHCHAELNDDQAAAETCPVCHRSLVDVRSYAPWSGTDAVSEDSAFLSDEPSLPENDELSDDDDVLFAFDDQDETEQDDNTLIAGSDSDTVQNTADVIVEETVIAEVLDGDDHGAMSEPALEQDAGQTFVPPGSPTDNDPDATYVPDQDSDGDATFIPTADIQANPNADATFLPHAASSAAGPEDPTFPGSGDPADQATRIGQYDEAWSFAVSQPGVTDETSLKLNLPQSAVADSTLVIQPRSMRSSEDAEANRNPSDYDLITLLGKGGMGVVYAARQASIDRTVAVKMLKPGTEKNDDARNKFLSEACVTGDLEHPNIVPIYDVGRDASGAFFYAMKRVQGTPWKNVIGEKSLDENLQILMRVADAVAFAHSKGILHRDLKPENTMLGEFGEVLVMDWGLAMPIDLERRFGGIVQVPDIGGTPAYMAPEMILGPLPKIGIRSDVYLLGAILYEIATGLKPHRSTAEMNCIHAAAHNIIQPTEKSGELINIARKAMKTDPRMRYSSVIEFQEAVRQYQSHSESIHLSDRATQHLQDARQSAAYDDFNEALFGFRQAIELWDGNETAVAELQTTQFEYASAAQAKGDYDLASSLLNVSLPPHAALHADIVEAARQRELRQQRAKTYRRVGVGLAGLLFVVVSGAAVWINKERSEAIFQKEEAVRQQGVAEEQRQLAEDARDQVIKEKEKVEVQRQKAVDSAQEAERQRQNAVDAAAEAQRQEMLAKASEAKAKTQEMRAVQAAAESLRQKKIAEEQKDLAEQQRMLAEEKKREAEQARRAEAYEAYVARIGSAAARIEENAYDQARILLQQCQPLTTDDEDHRGWEWQRLWYLCQQASSTVPLPAAAESVDTVWNADGSLQQFAVGMLSGAVQIHDGRGAVRSSITTGGRVVRCVDYSPDGRQLLVASDGQGLHMFAADSGQRILTFDVDKQTTVYSAQFSANGRLVVSTNDNGQTTIWNAIDGTALVTLHGHRGIVHQATLENAETPTRLITVGEDGAAIVWTDASGRWNDAKSIEQSPPFSEHSGQIFAVAISADGNTVATAGHDQQILLWKISDLKEFDFEAAVAGDPDSVNSQVPATSLDGHTAAIRSLSFSNDGTTLASAGHDNAIRIWSLPDPQTRLQPVRVRTSTTESAVLLKTLRGHGQWIRCCRISPDANSVVSTGLDQTARVWDIAAYQESAPLQTQTLNGHDDAVLDARFSPSGKHIVTASRDRTLRTWDAATGSLLHSFREGHSFLATTATYSADGSKLATAAVDGTVRLWDARTGSQQHVLTETGRGAVVAFSPDMTLLATGGPVQASDGQQPAQWKARLWDVATGTLKFELPGHDGVISAVAFSSDGRQLFCGDSTGLGILWNAATGEQIRLMKWHTARIIAARFVRDGSLITAAAERAVVKWNVNTGKVDEANLLLHDQNLTAVDVDESGRYVVTACKDNSVRLWDFSTKQILNTIAEPAQDNATDTTRVTGIALSANRRFVAIADAGRKIVRLFDVASGTERIYPQSNDRRGPFLTLPPSQPLQSVAFATDSQSVLVIGGDRVTLYSTDNAQLPFRRLLTNYSPQGVVASVDYSPDERQIVSGSWDSSAVIWDAATGRSLRKLTGAHRAAVNSAAFNPVSAMPLVLTTSDDGTAVLWKSDTGEFAGRFSGHTGRVLYGCFSPDGKQIVTTSDDGTVRLWDISTFDRPLHVFEDHTDAVSRATFSHDGRQLATASADNSAVVRDLSTGTIVCRLSGHAAAVNDVSFTADGRRIITASDDFHCKVWDASTGKELLTLKGHTREITSVAFTPVNNALLTSSLDSTAIVWPATTPTDHTQQPIPQSKPR